MASLRTGVLHIVPRQTPKEIVDNVISVFKTRARRRNQNFFDLVRFFPNNGVGYAFQKRQWPAHKYIVIDHVSVNTIGGRRGEVWGRLHVYGRPIDKEPRRIRSVNKRGYWQFIPYSKIEERLLKFKDRALYRQHVQKALQQDKKFAPKPTKPVEDNKIAQEPVD